MTHSNYTRTELVNLSISELREICDRLSLPHRRSKADCITDILAAQPQLVAQAELEAHIEAQAEEIAPDLQRLAMNSIGYQDAVNRLEMQSNDPCYRSGYERGLRDVLPIPESSDEEAIAFEKIGQTMRGGVWESVVNGIQILIIGVNGGYKSNLTGVKLIEDFGLAIKESLVAVARIQVKLDQGLRMRSEGAIMIKVLEQHGNEFVAQNTENGAKYVVRPEYQQPELRCECADCHYRGVKCKHQIAVDNFLGQRLVAA